MGSDGDLERLEICDVLAPYQAREVPDDRLGQYPLYAMFPFLSVAAYRYYMPRCIEFSLAHPNNELSESLLFSLSGTFCRARRAAFSPKERAVVREYIECVARNVGEDRFTTEARKLWA